MGDVLQYPISGAPLPRMTVSQSGGLLPANAVSIMDARRDRDRTRLPPAPPEPLRQTPELALVVALILASNGRKALLKGMLKELRRARSRGGNASLDAAIETAIQMRKEV